MNQDLVVTLSRRLSAKAPKARTRPPGVRLASVALIHRPRESGDLDLLFIERARQSGDPWSGQMAFPGGRMDPDDGTLVRTAVRETREEVGVDLDQAGRLVGRLDDVQGMARGRPIPLIIRPHVFVLTRPVVLRPNPDEVASTVWISLSWLLSGQGRDTMAYTWHGVTVPLPCVRDQGYVIWGMTYRMLDNLLDRLRAREAFTSSTERVS